MANQDNQRATFPAYLVEHPFDSTLSSGILPPDLEDSVENVRANELVNLVFGQRRMDPALETGILSILPRDTNYTCMWRWFETLFGNVGVFSQLTPRFEALRSYQFVQIPEAVTALFVEPADQRERDAFREQYGAQAFLRGLLTDLWIRDPALARAFLATLRPSFQAAPAPAPAPVAVAVAVAVPVPAPHPSQPQSQPAMNLPTSTTALASIEPEPEPKPRWYCPNCGRNFQEGDFRMLKSHWFTEHFRSNRAAAWLENQRVGGNLGPWTAEEARKNKMDRGSIAETEGSRKKRAAMKSEVNKWRIGMQIKPFEWEKKAQEEDGYDDWQAAFVDYTRQKRAVGRKEAEKKQKGKKGGKKGGQ